MRAPIRVGIAIATVVTAAGALAPAAAMAGTDSGVSSTTGATAKFVSYGDKIMLCDQLGDTFSVYAQYYVNGGAIHTTSQHNGGNGTCDTRTTGDPAEGAQVTVRAGRQVDGGADNYGPWKSGRA
ncbi:hypothetical protein OG474_22640 [Kribbella sp. NBC_01505]|uniref:hypothetical protein n=1 Tax=Kribbella sp. NBC_01505 TaxID=2903580 RepID=UPI00386B03D7